MGVTDAVLKLEGTVPDWREVLMMSVMRGERVGRQAFTRAVGMGSREQVEALASEASLATWGTSTREKEEKLGGGGGVSEGGVSLGGEGGASEGGVSLGGGGGVSP